MNLLQTCPPVTGVSAKTRQVVCIKEDHLSPSISSGRRGRLYSYSYLLVQKHRSRHSRVGLLSASYVTEKEDSEDAQYKNQTKPRQFPLPLHPEEDGLFRNRLPRSWVANFFLHRSQIEYLFSQYLASQPVRSWMKVAMIIKLRIIWRRPNVLSIYYSLSTPLRLDDYLLCVVEQQDSLPHIGSFLDEALKEYADRNKNLPQLVIFQLNFMFTNLIKDLKKWKREFTVRKGCFPRAVLVLVKDQHFYEQFRARMGVVQGAGQLGQHVILSSDVPLKPFYINQLLKLFELIGRETIDKNEQNLETRFVDPYPGKLIPNPEQWFSSFPQAHSEQQEDQSWRMSMELGEQRLLDQENLYLFSNRNRSPSS